MVFRMDLVLLCCLFLQMDLLAVTQIIRAQTINCGEQAGFRLQQFLLRTDRNYSVSFMQAKSVADGFLQLLHPGSSHDGAFLLLLEYISIL